MREGASPVETPSLNAGLPPAVDATVKTLLKLAEEGGYRDMAMLADQTRVTGNRVELVVYGMSCPLCATSLDSEIARLTGYESMTSDLGDGKVVVNFKGDKRPTRGEVADAVQTAGFTLKEFK